MRILLTGGNGFIGKNILKSYLAEKYEIMAPRSFQLDLANQNSVDGFFANNEFDVVIHSAVKPGHRNSKDTSNLLNTNVRMFFNLLRHKKKYAKFISLGSGAIYDMRHYQAKMKEEYAGIHIPTDDHGLCKYIVEKQIEHLDNFVDLRIFGIFGPYEDYSIRFISNAICKALFDLPITLKQNKKFDYLFIEDLMPILDFFINTIPSYKAYNITPDISVDLLQIAQKIKNISQKPHLPILIAQNTYGLEYSGDNSRLKKEMPSLKFTSLENAIMKLYQWYETNKKLINEADLLIDK